MPSRDVRAELRLNVRGCPRVPDKMAYLEEKKQGNRGNLLLWPYQFFDVRLFYVFPVYGFASNGSLQGVMINLCRFSNVSTLCLHVRHMGLLQLAG